MFHVPFEKRFYRNNKYGKSKDLRAFNQEIWYRIENGSIEMPKLSSINTLLMTNSGFGIKQVFNPPGCRIFLKLRFFLSILQVLVLSCSVSVLGHIF
jgi:hypothetical protein